MTAALVLLTAVAAQALTIRPAFADHNSTYTVCPDPVNEGDSARMGIRRSGHKILSAVAFTDSRYYTADPDDYTEYHGVKFEQSEGRTLWFPIETTADTRPEHDETFAIGYFDDNVWHHCVVTILDDDAPKIISVEIITTPLDGWAYRAGESIDVAVTFDMNVEVEGSPLLALYVDDGNDSDWRGARYRQGSGMRELVFRYVVQPSDVDSDGLTVGAAATSDDRSPAYGFSGTITVKGTDVPVDYAHPGIDANWRQQVDGRPYVRSTRITSRPEAGRDTYHANEIIEFAFEFSSPMVVQGDVCVDLYLGDEGNTDDTVKQAAYRSGSGTNTLTFGYTVQPGDMDAEGIRLAMGWNDRGFCGSGTITGKTSHVQANPQYLGTGHQTGHRVDTKAPELLAVSLLSRPADGTAYGVGETIDFEVAFSERVIFSGTPYLELNVGDATRRATRNSDRGTTTRLVFEYRVRTGDSDTDGIGVTANSLLTDGGFIEDRAGIRADTSHPPIAADPTHRVDG